MNRARELVNQVVSGASPARVVEKVLGPAGALPIGFMAQVFQYIKQNPGTSVEDVIAAFPTLEPQRAEVPGWISDTLQGRSII